MNLGRFKPPPAAPSPGVGPAEADTPFASFWMGGYEGADHVNGAGHPLDLSAASGHADRIEEDHALAASMGLRCVRESIGWRLAEPEPGRYDLARAARIAASARRHGLQVLWTLMHYGTPPDVSLLDDGMVDRFAHFARAVAQALAREGGAPPVYNLINEIGFLSWTISETNDIHPYRGDPFGTGADTRASGYAVKRRLVAATLAAWRAVRRVEPCARFLHVEPLVHVVAPADQPDLAPLARRVADYQWQAWDMIAGLADPELGGSREALDLLGVNHYHSGQWEVGTEARLHWHLNDPRRARFSALLGHAWARYRRPLIVAETGHFGVGRAAWLDEVASEVATAREAGVPVAGLCLYPLVDRPDWDDPAHWHHAGLWDVCTDPGPAGAPTRSRLLCIEYAATLQAWQQRLPGRALQAAAPASTAVVAPLP